MTWPTRKLGEVVDLNYGKGISRADRSSDGKYPVYGANGVLDYSDKYLVDGEAVIIGRKGSAGEVTRVSGKFWPSDVTYYVLGNEKIDVDYLFHLFKRLRLQRFAVGVKPGINRNRIYEIQISLPTIGEQRKIVENIEKLFAKIDEAQKLREESKKSASALLQSALNEIFSGQKFPPLLKLRRASKKWGEKTIEDLCIVRSGGTPSKAIDSYWEDGKVPWLRSESCKDEKISSAKLYITQKGLENSSAKILKPRTTLIALVGATIGKTGFLNFKSTTNQNIAGLYPKNEEKLLPEFLFICAKNLYPHFLNIGKGKFKMANLSFVKSLKIPLPPLAEQKKIVAYFDSLSEKVRILRQAQDETATDFSALRQSILSQAFSRAL